MNNLRNLDSSFKEALRHHCEGRLREAEVLYRQILKINHDHPHALSMLGMIMMNNTRHAEAELLFSRHLKVDPDNSLTLHSMGRLLQMKGHDEDAITLFKRAIVKEQSLAPLYNDLAISLHRMGQRDEALAALDHALIVDATFSVAHDNRGRVLYDCRRYEEAVQAYQAALVCTPHDAAAVRKAIWAQMADAAYMAEEYELAAETCRSILEMDPADADAIEYLTKALYRLGREGEAKAHLNQCARARGLIRKGKTEHPEARILILGAVGAGHVPTRCLFDPELFETMTINLLSPDQPDAPLGNIPYDVLTQADIIFNTLGEVERDGGQIGSVKKLVERLGKPLLNLPSRIACTGRHQTQALYGGISGLIVPCVRCIVRGESIDPAVFTAPFLIRPNGTHGGEDLALIKSPANMAHYLAKVQHDQFLATDFHDFKSADNCYRKYRFIFVDRQPYPYHLAIAENWLVHYWRADMEKSEWKRREEELFLRDWRNVFGRIATAAVEEVAQRMNLDYGGLDCSVLLSGEVLFFEANACMLMQLDDTEGDFLYKRGAVYRIRDAMTTMVRRKTSTTPENCVGRAQTTM
jgi:Flp pilus assembly protein TadD